MPLPLQQLIRGSYRSCQALSCMHKSVQTLRLLHQHPGTSALGRQQRPRARPCSLCAHQQLQTIAHSSRSPCSSKQPLVYQVQPWASSGLSSSTSSSSRRGRASSEQHVCHASSGSTPQPAEPSGSGTVLTLPTILTLGRVAAIPALIAAWFWQDPAASTVVTGLFIVASITDWLDGYLARKMNASTPFGAFLDPVADKLMVAAVLILLSTQPLAAGPFAGNTWFVPVTTLIIIGREISMSALREWAATLGPAAKAAVAVNAWGKWKTATQMVALTCLLLTKDGAQGQLGAVAAAAGPPLLAVAAWLTAHSLALYVAGLWRFMK